MHLGGKCKISWSNDELERFFVPPHESIRFQGAMADRVKKGFELGACKH